MKNASDDARQVGKYARHLRVAGLVAKVLKPVGPLLTVPSIIYDIRSGYSGRRAVFTNVSSLGAGAIVVGVFAVFTPPAWLMAVGVGLGAVVGFLVGQEGAPDVYDKFVASPKERLLQTPDAPDLDPGPAQLPGE